MKIQLEFDLSAKRESFEDCCKKSLYGCGRQLKYVAADINVSPAKLSRMFSDNPNDPINFPLKDLPKLIEATGTLDIIYWLINKFLADGSKAREQAVDQLLEILPKLKPLIEMIEDKEEDVPLRKAG